MVIRFRNISVRNVIEGNNLIIDIKLMTWMLIGRRIRMDFSDGDSDGKKDSIS